VLRRGAGARGPVSQAQPAPDFPEGLEWLNTPRPLALADLNEPEAVLVTGDMFLVADTNNQRLLAASLRGDGCDESSLHEVTIRLPPM